MRRLVAAVGILFAALAPAAGAATAEVQVRGNAFAPSTVTIAPGDSVAWTFAGPDLNHSVTSESGQSERFDSDPGEPFPTHAAGDRFSHTFNATGSFTYLCKVHSFMRGRVNVRAPGTEPPPPAADTTAPAISKLRARGATSKRRRTTVSFSLSEAASVAAAFKRSRGKSPRPITRALAAGSNTVSLSRRRVPPGRYTVAVRARDDAGNRSATARVTVTVR